jgi:superfamily I DNA/RNA helicase
MSLEGLNAEQRRAVEAPDGPVMIVAGPGTGKTKTLTARIVWLLEQGVPAGEILALTFTRKAAAEMRQRVEVLVRDGELPEITTFHALALNIAGVDERAFASNVERHEIVRGLKLPAEWRGVGRRELGLRLSNYKNRLEPASGAMADLVAQYDAALRERGRRDFDDLLRAAFEQLQPSDEVARRKYVLIDEFQDTNEVQYELAKRLEGEGGLFVIGDPRQSIYGFRGASGYVFEQFSQDFSGALVVNLRINYRSAPELVAAGNAVFGAGADLVAGVTAGGRARAMETLNEYSEAAWIVAEIESAVGGTDLLKASGIEPVAAGFRDFAVVYRTHRSAQALVRRLDDSGIPFQVAGEGSPYERPPVADVVAVLRRLAGGGAAETLEDEWLHHELEPLVGNISVADLAEQAAGHLGVMRDDESRRELERLMSVSVRFGTDLRKAVRYYDELAESEYYDPAAEAVTLTTIHAAKGLEFEHVFVLGAEEGLLPFVRPGLASDVDEEQRLFYVSVTRAKRRLDILHVRDRGNEQRRPSRFLDGLPLERMVDPDMAALIRKRRIGRAKRAQGTLF